VSNNANQDLSSNAQPKSNLELIMEAFMASQNQKFDELNVKVDLLATQNKLLETQVTQQSSQVLVNWDHYLPN
jgi:hypothetical protein